MGWDGNTDTGNVYLKNLHLLCVRGMPMSKCQIMGKLLQAVEQSWFIYLSERKTTIVVRITKIFSNKDIYFNTI